MRIKSGRTSLELYVGHCWLGGEFFSTVGTDDPRSSYSKGRKGSPQINGDSRVAKGGALGEAVFTGKQRMRREKKCSNRKTAQRTIIETVGTSDRDGGRAQLWLLRRKGMGDGHKQFDWKSRRWSEENLRERRGSFNVRKAEP